MVQGAVDITEGMIARCQYFLFFPGKEEIFTAKLNTLNFLLSFPKRMILVMIGNRKKNRKFTLCLTRQ